jgi:hypothetical protein
MIFARLSFDASTFERRMSDAERKQYPYAMMLALNETVIGGRKAVQQEMDKVFDRPTPYAKRGVVYDRAWKDKLVADVAITGDRTRGGLPATAFLGPEVYGGQRALKAFERQLQERGHLLSGEVTVPASKVKLDRYGNVAQAFLNRVMADLQIDYRGAGATRRRTDRSLKTNKRYRTARFFVPKRGGRLAPGVYQRDPRDQSIFPVLLFVSARSYAKRLAFEDVVHGHAATHFGENFAKAFAKAMASAR